MATQSLPLQIIANVTVITSSPQVSAPTYNAGLIIGPTVISPPDLSTSKVRKYLFATFSQSMITDGYTVNSPEYICAQLYFSQTPPPQILYIGQQSSTAIGTAVPNAGNAGTNYKVGDVVSVTQSSASGGFLQVSTISTGGVVTGVTTIPGQQGKGYSVATALTTTGGSGTGLKVDITAIGESALNAAIACRAASPYWYPFMVTSALDADHIAISSWVSSQVGTVYFGTTQSAAALAGTAGNVLSTIFGASSKRTWMQFATTQGGYPNQIYFVAAIMGQAMASNSQLQNSAFTEKFSGGVPLQGVYTEPLNINQVNNIEGSVPAMGPNGNLYLNYGGAFRILEQGTMMSQLVFFDQILNLDMLASNIQYAIMNVLTSVPKIPQTDAGQQILIQAVESACDQMVNIGYIGPGIWEGQTILTLTPGTALPQGYLVQSPKYNTMTQADIQARKSPPIYVAIIESGAVHFVTIAVIVQA